MKPIHKFNNGQGATLCHKCNCIISLGRTNDLYCKECKQETLEEVAYNYASKKLQRPITIYVPLESNVAEYVGFIEGAKWQQEQIYNQIKDLCDNENITGFTKRAYAQCLDIIEQFKNK